MERSADTNWHKSIPVGPLTRETHRRLDISYLDGSRGEVQRVAAERGVESGESLRLDFAEKIARRRADIQRLEQDQQVPEHQ